MPMTRRERFLTLLYNGPLLRGDAAIVLCGEDTAPRIAVAAQLVKQQGAEYVVLSGGKHEPPRWQGAESLFPEMMGTGIVPDRILMDMQSQNTREQAVHMVALAAERKWKRLLLVASAYHTARAFLTFVRALADAGMADTIHLVPVAAAHTPWDGVPTGMAESRMDLASGELDKIDQYRVMGHVASYADGIKYLRAWEGK